LPATPIEPTFLLDMRVFNHNALGTIWRQPCQDGSGDVAVLIRMTVVTSPIGVCGTPTIVQDGFIQAGTLATSTSGSPTFCDDLVEPTTVVLLARPGFDERAAFTLVYGDLGAPMTSVHIPAASFAPPRVVTLTVHPLGCTTCRPGQVLGFELQVSNSGAPLLVELKTGARLPGGSVVSILGRHEEEVIGTGVTVIPLFAGFVLPAGIPAGVYAIEGALLEPELGVTISRHSVPLTLTP
jgi:hypothetical protein